MSLFHVILYAHHFLLLDEDLTDNITYIDLMWKMTFSLSLFAGGLYAILTDQNKLVVAVGGATALAAGVYTTRYNTVLCRFFSQAFVSITA